MMSNKTYNNVDLLSIALVREYLSRKGYKTTLNQFDKESLKRDESIQNRRVLAEELGIIDHVKKNKERGAEALKSFLEMIVYYLLSLKEDSSTLNRTATSVSRRSTSRDALNTSTSSANAPFQHKTIPRKEYIELNYIPTANSNALNTSSSSTGFAKLSLEGSMNSSTGLCSKRKKLVHNIIDPSSPRQQKISPRRSSRTNLVSAEDTKQQKTATPVRKHTRSNEMKLRSDLVIMDDVDTMPDDVNSYEDNYEEELIVQSESITLDIAVKLKTLIFGTALSCFNAEWIQQGFKFCQHPLLRYGLVQEKGGPCGLMASVQAVLLKHWLFESVDQNTNKGVIAQPNPSEQTASLVNALVDILILVSQKNSNIVVTLPSNRTSKFTPSKKYKNDKLTEKLQLFDLSPDGQLKRFISKNISYFTNSNGCILFLYSVVLSCGVENIKNDMDEADGMLMGSHGYCTQEMVNLLLTGKAVSNVFDGDMELDSGEEHMVILHGVKTRCDIGFLSLFEHYESCKVGDNYKNPNYPIWVVCSESHFSLLFSPVHLVNTGKSTPFDLYYYDGLGRQDEEIRLTVTKKTFGKIPSSSTELIPPLELCIRTKWKSSTVSWNGTEPIL